eukprot:488527-Alexandrium_andersonii.AAC.1
MSNQAYRTPSSLPLWTRHVGNTSSSYCALAKKAQRQTSRSTLPQTHTHSPDHPETNPGEPLPRAAQATELADPGRGWGEASVAQ